MAKTYTLTDHSAVKPQQARPTFSFERLRAGLSATAILLTVAACGGGGGGHADGPSGSTASTGPGIPTPGSAVVGVVPAQASAQLALLAGSASGNGFRDGPGSYALFSLPVAVAVDAAGNRYVADSLNEVIRKIDSNGNVSTYAGNPGVVGELDGSAANALFEGFQSMAIDGAGNLFVTEPTNVVRKISASGQVSTLAGLTGQTGSTDGPSTQALFNTLGATAADSNGNVYVVDSSGLTIRKITPSGVVTTIFGTAGVSASSTGNPALGTRIDTLAFDGSNDLYFVDNGELREISPSGVVSTVSMNIHPVSPAGTFACGGITSIAWNGNGFAAISGVCVFDLSVTGIDTPIYTYPAPVPANDFLGTYQAIAVDATGNIYVPTLGLNNEIDEISPTGVRSILAGHQASFGDIDGTGSSASFGIVSEVGGSTTSYGIAADSAGNLYVADSGNNTIRKVTAAGVVTTIAGQSQLDSFGNVVTGYVDGQGTAARFNQPTGIVVNSAGMIYVADTGNQVIRQITPQGLVTTLAGTPAASILQAQHADGTGASARFSSPGPLAIDKAGNLYVGDNAVETATMAGPEVIQGTTVRKVTPLGAVTTIAGDSSSVGFVNGSVSSAQFQQLTSVAIDPIGNIFVVDVDSEIREISRGEVSTAYPSLARQLNGVTALAIDAAGNFYVAGSQFPSQIQKIDTSGNLTAFAGTPPSGFRPGPLPGGLYNPSALTVYGNGLAVMMPGSVATIQ